MNKMITTYEPDNSIKKGFLHIFKEIFNELKMNKWLTYQLFKRDFLALYKQSFFGILWAIIVPLISVATFIILNRAGVFSIGDIDIPYPLYAILGMSFWQLFSSGLIACTNSLVMAGPMVVKINFSKKSIVIASFGKSVISFLIQLILAVILFIIYGIMPNVAILLIPILLIPIILFTLGLGFILSLLNGIMRDIGNMISSIIVFLLFLTPVLYAKPSTGLLTKITNYNPLYYLISTPREFLLTGNISEWKGYLISSIISIIIFILCLVIFHLTETRITERL